jgi:NADPH:quinone reductase-like Zn-dependent oxidoreductase
MSKTGHGTIAITAGETTYTLKPTLRAFRAIESRFNGILPAMNAVGSASVTSAAFVIAAGTGVDTNKRKDLEVIEEVLFDAGVSSVGSQVIAFLSALLNPSGKTDAELEEEKKAAESGNE